MSLNYGALKNAVNDFLARQDISDAAYTSFLLVVESDIRASVRLLEADTEVDLEIENGRAQLPADYLDSTLVEVGGQVLLQTDIQSLYEDMEGDQFATVGNNFIFGRGVQGKTAHVIYRKQLPGLGPDNQENDVTRRYPNVYLMGVLREASFYIDDKEKAAQYNERFMQALQDAGAQEDQRRFAGSRLVANLGN